MRETVRSDWLDGEFLGYDVIIKEGFPERRSGVLDDSGVLVDLWMILHVQEHMF